MLWNQDRPVDESHDKWICNRCIEEDAEECTILSRGVLAGRREELLETGRAGLDLVDVVRVVEVHESPHLRGSSKRDAWCEEEVLTNASQE
jgi:hypothetical protein